MHPWTPLPQEAGLPAEEPHVHGRMRVGRALSAMASDAQQQRELQTVGPIDNTHSLRGTFCRRRETLSPNVWPLVDVVTWTMWTGSKSTWGLLGKWKFKKTIRSLHSLPVGCLTWGDPALGSADSMVGLMATFRRAYAKGDLPGLLLAVPRPCDEPLPTHASTGDPPTLSGMRHLCWI